MFGSTPFPEIPEPDDWIVWGLSSKDVYYPEFEPDALREVAKTAMERKTGARGLRSVIEKTMMDVMYEAPSNENMKKCVITKEAVTGKGKPVVTIEENPEKKPARSSKRRGTKRAGRPETA